MQKVMSKKGRQGGALEEYFTFFITSNVFHNDFVLHLYIYLSPFV